MVGFVVGYSIAYLYKVHQWKNERIKEHKKQIERVKKDS